MNTIISILRFDLRPWLDKNNKPEDYYSPELRSTPSIQEEFIPHFITDFSIPAFSIKIKYYQRLIDNSITDFLNRIFSETEGESDNLIAFKLKKANGKVKSLMTEINDLILSKDYNLNLIASKHSDFSTDRQHKEATYIFQYMLTALIKCYLEIQHHFSAHIHEDDLLDISEIYSSILNKPTPDITFIKQVQMIQIEHTETINPQHEETDPTYAVQYAQDKHTIFMEKVSPYRFVELPKYSALNQTAQNRLTKEIIENPVHYSVAMLNFLGYMEYLKKTYSLSKEKIYKHISQALKTDVRTVKGNCLVLNPNSNEDRYKYQADQYSKKVEQDYNKILAGKSLE